MKITVKSNEYGMGFYGDGEPLFWHKDGDDTLSLLQSLIYHLGAPDIENAGEISYDEMEQDFA